MAKLVIVPVPNDVDVKDVSVSWHGNEAQFVKWLEEYGVQKDDIESLATGSGEPDYKALHAVAEVEGQRVQFYGHPQSFEEPFVATSAAGPR